MRSHVDSQLLQVLLLHDLVLRAECVDLTYWIQVFEKLVVLRASEVVLGRWIGHQLHLVVLSHVLLGCWANSWVGFRGSDSLIDVGVHGSSLGVLRGFYSLSEIV